MYRGKNKIVAALLAFFLGGFGIHHFYLGSPGAAIACIALTCFFGIGYLLAWFEAFLLVLMPDAEFEMRYNHRSPDSTEFVFWRRA